MIFLLVLSSVFFRKTLSKIKYSLPESTALGKALKTLGKLFAECRALGKEGSTHSVSAKPSLLSTFFGHSAKTGSTRQRKAAVTVPDDGDGVFPECPSVLDDTRQRSYLCRVSVGQHSAKNPQAGSPCQVLCRVICMALGKACFFAECQSHYTRQRTYTGAQVLVLCQVSHSAK
jgi:hypothetical protein